MNWTVYAIFVYAFLALQTGLAPAFTLADGWRYGPIAPRLELILVVFVGLFASRGATLAAWLVMGLAIDLLHLYPPLASAPILVGPFTLGFLAGGLIVHHIRGMVLRTHPLSMAFCVFVSGLAVSLVVVVLFTIRSWYEPMPGFAAGPQLLARILSLAYTAALSLLFAWPLLKAINLLGLQVSRQARR